MKNRILLGILGLFSFVAAAQNVIRIRPQHQKEHLYTLKKGERIGRNESNLDMHLKGANYEFMTIKGTDYYRHTRNGVKKLVGKRYLPSVFKNWKIKMVEDKYVIKSRLTKQTYGPMKNPSLYYDRSKKLNAEGTYVTSESDLYGVVYSAPSEKDSNGEPLPGIIWNNYVIKPGEKPRGPFKRANILSATDQEFIFSYELDEKKFLSKNDKIYGPYEYLSYRKYKTIEDGVEVEKELFIYRVGTIWKIEIEQFKAFTFSEPPKLQYTGSGRRLILKIIEKENKAYVVLPDGSLREESDAFFVVSNNKQEELTFRSIDDTTYRGAMNKYEVSFKEEVLGEFYLNTSRKNERLSSESDYFVIALVPADSIAANEYYNQFIYYSPTLGYTESIKIKPGNTIYLLDESYALYNEVSDTLEYDDKIYSDVLAVDFTEYPKNWWLIRSEGDIDQPYKNGVLTNSFKTIPKGMKSYDTPDKPFVRIQKGEDFFVKTRRNKKLFGPINKYSNVLVSNDEQNYIECKRGENTIWINGVLISSGFYMVYNKHLDAFHWLSILDENKIYLHTYELN